VCMSRGKERERVCVCVDEMGTRLQGLGPMGGNKHISSF